MHAQTLPRKSFAKKQALAELEIPSCLFEPKKVGRQGKDDIATSPGHGDCTQTRNPELHVECGMYASAGVHEKEQGWW
jgi:hypothetical protein